MQVAWTQQDLDAVKSAIASGATRVKYADREVQYQSLTDLLRIKAVIEAEMGKTKVLRHYPSFDKGV